MERVYINDELFFVADEEAFAQLLESQLGHEAAEAFRNFCGEAEYDKDGCDGECDRLYDAQETFERGIQEALDILSTVEGKKTDATALEQVRECLEGLI